MTISLWLVYPQLILSSSSALLPDTKEDYTRKMDLIDAGNLLKCPQSLDTICQILLIYKKGQAFKDLCYAVLKVTGYNKGNDVNHRGRIQIRKKGFYGAHTVCTNIFRFS